MGTTKGACGAGPEEVADELGERVAARGFVTREDFVDALLAAEARGIEKAAKLCEGIVTARGPMLAAHIRATLLGG